MGRSDLPGVGRGEEDPGCRGGGGSWYSFLMRTLSLVLAGALAAPPPSGAVAVGPESEAGSSAQALYQAGERAFGVGDFDRAIANFEAAYDASKLIDILYNVALAYVRRFEISGDRKDLLRARAVLRNYVLELESNPSLGSTDDAKALQAEIDKLLGSSPEQGEEAERPARKTDRLTIGLGAAGALAGVSLVVAGAAGATIARQPFQGRGIARSSRRRRRTGCRMGRTMTCARSGPTWPLLLMRAAGGMRCGACRSPCWPCRGCLWRPQWPSGS